MFRVLLFFCLDMEESRDDLDGLIKENKLPFFAYYSVNNQKPSSGGGDGSQPKPQIKSDTEDIIFLYKIFDAKCFFAKCYSQKLQSFLLHHRPSYVSTDTPSLTVNKASMNSAANSFIFSDVVAIPYNYKGTILFPFVDLLKIWQDFFTV
jgi:hypothetical protein